MILYDGSNNRIGEASFASDVLSIEFFDAQTQKSIGKLRTRGQESNEIINWLRNAGAKSTI